MYGHALVSFQRKTEIFRGKEIDYKYFQMDQHNNISIYYMERESKLAKC